MSPPPISEASSIRVAEYLNELPPREVLEQKREAAVAQLLEERIWENIGENFGE